MWKRAARVRKQKRVHDRPVMREEFGAVGRLIYDTPLLNLHVLNFVERLPKPAQ